MKICACYMSFLYYIAILSDILNGCEKISDFSVSDDEIANLVNKLRQEDINKIDNEQIILDYQGRITTRNSDDKSERRLFTWVDQNLLKKDTYKALIALNNEYKPEIGVEEKGTPAKVKAIDDFINAVFETKVWQIFYEFLHEKFHPYAENLTTFRAWIDQLWFEEYSRGSDVIDSSGFEHVFLGEHKNERVIGMHSWLRFYLLERNESQQFNYHGYTTKRFNIMAAVKFSWRNHLKRIGSFFIGTSPEFDLSLYTLCFLTRQTRNTCKFELDECPFVITSYNFKQKEKNYIGTVYPVAGPLTNKCRQYHSSAFNLIIFIVNKVDFDQVF